MLLSRILGAVGRTFITLGVMTLLFVAYQLWGTGLLTAQAQADLENDFEALLEEAEAVTADLDDTTLVSTGAGDDEVAIHDVDELTAEERTARIELANLLWQPDGEAVAQLLIPDIGLSKTVVAGVGVEALRKGPGHYPNTPLPGMEGNASIAGHRTTWGAPFNRIDELEPGAEITVRTAQGTFVYRVMEQDTGKGHFIVSPDRVDVLDQDFTDAPNRLTLTACHPKYSARQRIIVVAELVGEPAAFIPRPFNLPLGDIDLASEDVPGAGSAGDDADLPGDPDLVDAVPDDADIVSAPTDDPADDPTDDPTDDEDDTDQVTVVADSPTAPGSDDFGEGLDGDSSAVLPAVMWGLAAAAMWTTGGFLARRWRRWPTYALGIVPFAMVLFVCFVNIDKALPSY